MNRRQFGLTALASAAMVAVPSVLRAQNMYEVIDVPAGRGPLQETWAALQRRELLGNEYVTVRLGPGTHQFDRLFAPEHGNGRQIGIIGTPGATYLEWVNTSGPTGIRLSRGHYLRKLAGVTITRPSAAVWPDNSPAIFLRDGSNIELEDVAIHGYAYGTKISTRSGLTAVKTQVYDALDVAMYADTGSTQILIDCLADNVAEPGNKWGWGFKTETGASMYVRDSVARNCLKQGFATQGNSSGKAIRCHSEFNEHGYGSTGNSVLGLYGCTGADNAKGRYIQHSGGVLDIK